MAGEANPFPKVQSHFAIGSLCGVFYRKLKLEVQSTAYQTITLWTLYRSYSNNISSNIELQVYKGDLLSTIKPLTSIFYKRRIFVVFLGLSFIS
jgi:hypothetical protein